MKRAFESDIEAILSHRYDNGGDFWATRDGRIYKGNPFSTIGSLGMLHELGVDSDHEAVKGGLDLIMKASRKPSTPIPGRPFMSWTCSDFFQSIERASTTSTGP